MAKSITKKRPAVQNNGFRLKICKGMTGCSNAIDTVDEGIPRLTALLEAAFPPERTTERAKGHHLFRVAVALCPNACSQPQIQDVGITAASVPHVSESACSQCGACLSLCRESAIRLRPDASPVLLEERCVACDACAAACPTGTLSRGRTGWRIALGGCLGRHPRLAIPISGIHSLATVLEIVDACIGLYRSCVEHDVRFSHILNEERISRWLLPIQKSVTTSFPPPGIEPAARTAPLP